MVLQAESKISGMGKANTLYVTIPSEIATDSQFPFKKGDDVLVKVANDVITIWLVKEGDK